MKWTVKRFSSTSCKIKQFVNASLKSQVLSKAPWTLQLLAIWLFFFYSLQKTSLYQNFRNVMTGPTENWPQRSAESLTNIGSYIFIFKKVLGDKDLNSQDKWEFLSLERSKDGPKTVRIITQNQINGKNSVMQSLLSLKGS